MTAQASNTGPLICRLILMPNDPLGQINSNNPHPCLSSLLAQRSEARGSRAHACAMLQLHGEHAAQVPVGDGRGPTHPDRLRNGGRDDAVASVLSREVQRHSCFPFTWVLTAARGAASLLPLHPCCQQRRRPACTSGRARVRGEGKLGNADTEMKKPHIDELVFLRREGKRGVSVAGERGRW